MRKNLETLLLMSTLLTGTIFLKANIKEINLNASYEITPQSIGCDMSKEDLLQYTQGFSNYEGHFGFPKLVETIENNESVIFARYQDETVSDSGENQIGINFSQFDKVTPIKKCSILVHELVHHFQYLTNSNLDNLYMRENEAYAVQGKFLITYMTSDAATGIEDVMYFKSNMRRDASKDQKETDMITLIPERCNEYKKYGDAIICKFNTKKEDELRNESE